MSVTENIFAGVITIMIFLTIFVVVNRSTTEFVVTDYQFKKEKYLSDLYAANFNSVLLVTEPVTKRPISSLLSDAVYYRDEIINYTNASINVSVELKDLLDTVYGEGRYYLEINPRVIDVSLNFVIDGSSSLEDERQKLASELPNIVQKIWVKINKTGEEQVTADIFILEDDSHGSDLCDIFPDYDYQHINSHACTVIDEDDIYYDPALTLGNQTFTTNSTDYLKYYYNLSTPYENETETNGIREGGIKDYYGSDWGTGTAYVGIIRKEAARLVLIFPMGDELSTSSINEDCFNIPISDYALRAEQKICDLCKESCSDSSDTETELRSKRTVDIAKSVSDDLNHIVNPIFAYNCEYEYKSIFNAQYQEVYGSSTSNVCDEGNCGGCSTDAGGGTCFHPECKDEILSQMNDLASSTNGQVIDLGDIENLDYDIENTINQNVEDYMYSLGEFRNITRYLVNRALPLPNRMMVDVKLFVYPIKEMEGENV